MVSRHLYGHAKYVSHERGWWGSLQGTQSQECGMAQRLFPALGGSCYCMLVFKAVVNPMEKSGM